MSYIDNTYYTDVYHGFKVSSLKFPYYSERATEKVNEYIEKIEVAEDVTDDVKKCTCAVMDNLYDLDNNRELTSESIGSYKVSFKDSTPGQSNDQLIYSIIVKYLGKTGLLYRGANYVY